MKDIGSNLYRAYYDTIYGVTKAVLAPVVDAYTDVFQEAVAAAFRDSAIKPAQTIGNVVVNGLEHFLGKK